MKKLLLICMVTVDFAQSTHANVFEMMNDLGKFYRAVEQMRKEEQQEEVKKSCWQ